MRNIRSKDTGPEIAVRRIVCAIGFRSRYRLHNTRLPGRPDLVFPKLRKIILIHGCFWHRHNKCALAHVPASRTEYWQPKLEQNRKRDRLILRRLRESGWKVLVVWECQVRRRHPTLATLIGRFLEGS